MFTQGKAICPYAGAPFRWCFWRALRRVLAALGPYREDLVLIGGWVPYLYQQFGGFPESRVEIARTIELDLVVPSPLAAEERQPLTEILVGAGFSAISRNEGAVWVREGAGDEMIEFFTAHRSVSTPAVPSRRGRGIGGRSPCWKDGSEGSLPDRLLPSRWESRRRAARPCRARTFA